MMSEMDECEICGAYYHVATAEPHDCATYWEEESSRLIKALDNYKRNVCLAIGCETYEQPLYQIKKMRKELKELKGVK